MVKGTRPRRKTEQAAPTSALPATTEVSVSDTSKSPSDPVIKPVKKTAPPKTKGKGKGKKAVPEVVPTNSDDANFKFRYKVAETVIAYHGAMLYDAKIVKAEVREHQGERKPLYFVHYQGWSKKWDEWADETRMMKKNEENEKKSKEINEAFKKRLQEAEAAKKKGKSKSSLTPEEKEAKAIEFIELTNTDRKKRRIEDLSSVVDFHEQVDLQNLQLSTSLKKFMVEEWEAIRSKKLVPLPRSHTVNSILNAFLEAEGLVGAKKTESITVEIVESIRGYFESALAPLLLYKFERLQYRQEREKTPGRSVCDIYGAEHLLRLFCKLPVLLATVNMTDESNNLLYQKIAEIVEFLKKNFQLYFTQEYLPTSAEYRKQFLAEVF